MATTVGQHAVAAFTSPSNGDALDATIVKGNDNTLRSAYVDHDNDPGIHVQSSTLALRPAAGTAGRKWITTDIGDVRFWYDNGSTWEEVVLAGTVPSLTVTGPTTLNGNTAIGDAATDTVTVTAQLASSLVPSTNNTRDLGSSANRFKDIYSAGTIYPAAVSGGTFTAPTLAGTTTNSGTISGGTVSGATLNNATFTGTISGITTAPVVTSGYLSSGGLNIPSSPAWTTLCSITVDAGTYMIFAYINAIVTGTSGGSTGVVTRVTNSVNATVLSVEQTVSASGVTFSPLYKFGAMAGILTVSSSATVTFQAFNSGSTTTYFGSTTTGIHAMKLT